MGVETILLIVILAFAAGFLLDRLAIRRGRLDAAKSKREQQVTSTSAPEPGVLVGHDAPLARVRRGKSPAVGPLIPAVGTLTRSAPLRDLRLGIASERLGYLDP
jgi:hypothetical protein